MFFGCDNGNHKNWLGKLNVDVPAVEFDNGEALKDLCGMKRLSDSD